MRILLQCEFVCIGSGLKLASRDILLTRLMHLIFSEVFVTIVRTAESTMVQLLVLIKNEDSAAGRTLMLPDITHFRTVFAYGIRLYQAVFFDKGLSGITD